MTPLISITLRYDYCNFLSMSCEQRNGDHGRRCFRIQVCIGNSISLFIGGISTNYDRSSGIFVAISFSLEPKIEKFRENEIAQFTRFCTFSRILWSPRSDGIPTAFSFSLEPKMEKFRENEIA